MAIDQSIIEDLVYRPSESLSVEIKRWINPDEPEGISKIVKASLALRNRDGGYLLIGFDNDQLTPDTENVPSDVRTLFHLDKIQALITKYASERFEIQIGFGIRDGQEYPVIVIPEGIRTPVAAKGDLPHPTIKKKYLIREGAVYFRTLASNGIPSSSEAKATDWDDIVSICFDNREADIGRFFRRHLTGIEASSLLEALTTLGTVSNLPHPSLREKALSLLDDGERRFKDQLSSRHLSPQDETLGTWSASLVIDPPDTNLLPDVHFLNTISSANPRYTGWPAWLDSRGFEPESEPRVIDKGWEALIFHSSLYEFIRLDPKGKFYQERILQDDLMSKFDPGQVLDPLLVIIRVAEVIAVGLSFAKALNWPETTHLGFAFRWTKLKGRHLDAWANFRYWFRSRGTAHQNTVDTFTEVSIDTPIAAIAPYVEEATRDLFLLFDGYRIDSKVIEEHTQRLIERRLS